MEKNELKTLLFIGNGFDVACDYATKYIEFVNDDKFKKLLQEGSDLCEYIERVKEKRNWVDLETELFNYSLSITAEYGENNQVEAEKFKREFLDLSEALQNYIISIQTTRERNSYKLVDMDNIVRLWCGYNNISAVVCFNYSQFFFISTVNKHYIKNTAVVQVHGGVSPGMSEAENDIKIVLGIDESMKVEPLHSFLYKSSNPNYRIEGISDLIKSADKYIIFGCSLGCTDEWYFKKAFTQKNKTIEVCYYGETERLNMLNNIRYLSGNLSDFRSDNALIMYDCSDLKKLHTVVKRDCKKRAVKEKI